MKNVILVLIIMMLPGCQMLGGMMGQTEYTVKPFALADGTIICCEAHIFNSKDYDRLKFKLVKKPDGTIEVTLDETGVSASNPATVNALNQGKMLDTITSLIPLITKMPEG